MPTIDEGTSIELTLDSRSNHIGAAFIALFFIGTPLFGAIAEGFRHLEVWTLFEVFDLAFVALLYRVGHIPWNSRVQISQTEVVYRRGTRTEFAVSWASVHEVMRTFASFQRQDGYSFRNARGDEVGFLPTPSDLRLNEELQSLIGSNLRGGATIRREAPAERKRGRQGNRFVAFTGLGVCLLAFAMRSLTISPEIGAWERNLAPYLVWLILGGLGTLTYGIVNGLAWLALRFPPKRRADDSTRIVPESLTGPLVTILAGVPVAERRRYRYGAQVQSRSLASEQRSTWAVLAFLAALSYLGIVPMTFFVFSSIGGAIAAAVFLTALLRLVVAYCRAYHREFARVVAGLQDSVIVEGTSIWVERGGVQHQ